MKGDAINMSDGTLKVMARALTDHIDGSAFGIPIENFYRCKAILDGLRAHGMEVVPVEPTHEMIEAGYEAPDHIALARRVVRNIYRAMITAATPTAGK